MKEIELTHQFFYHCCFVMFGACSSDASHGNPTKDAIPPQLQFAQLSP
jgi:hypothetical protein